MLSRAGQILNVFGEKLSEDVFFRALEEVVRQWPSSLKDYTVASSQLGPQSQNELSHRYLLFLELEGEPLTEEQTALVSCDNIRLYRENMVFGRLTSERIAFEVHRSQNTNTIFFCIRPDFRQTHELDLKASREPSWTLTKPFDRRLARPAAVIISEVNLEGGGAGPPSTMVIA